MRTAIDVSPGSSYSVTRAVESEEARTPAPPVHAFGPAHMGGGAPLFFRFFSYCFASIKLFRISNKIQI